MRNVFPVFFTVADDIVLIGVLDLEFLIGAWL